MNLLSLFPALLVLVASHVAVHASPVDASNKGSGSHQLLARADPPVMVPVNFATGQGECSDERKTIIRTEMSWAYAMAIEAYSDPQFGDYYNHFFSQSLRDQADFGDKVKERYRRMTDILSGRSPEFTVTVTCDETKEGCWKKGWWASMNDNLQVMNVCDAFFKDNGGFLSDSTSTTLDACDNDVMDLRYAQRAKSGILLHEMTHTSYGVNKESGALDVAYGYNGCTALARGTFDRSCVSYKAKPKKSGTLPTPDKIICQTTNSDGVIVEGICPADYSENNADTYSFVAAGIFFSKRCQKVIPYPATTGPPASGGGTKRQVIDSCPMADYVVWDGDDESARTRVAGYAHFGDSYASGMGTGTTSGDACRVGSNNYGDLIYKWLNDDSIAWEGPKSCSGDTTVELMQKLDAWSTAADTNVVTLTIGGNDLGFSDLVWYCIITPNTARLGSTNRKNCEEAQEKAFAMIQDEGDDGFKAKLKAAYTKVLQKGHDAGTDIMLYVAGYPVFFNTLTEDCKDSSFHYWWGGYKPSSDWPLNRIVYLTKKLRSEMFELVYRTNTAISEAVDEANEEWGETAVRFINIANSFDPRDGTDHSWCSSDDVHEPDENREDTWFFLSGWKDFDAESAAAVRSRAQDEAEAKALIQAGNATLPDAKECEGVTGSSGGDPWKLWQCRMAEAVAEDPSGPAAARFNATNRALGGGNMTIQDIDWWVPTRQIKTFHPRTRGMIAYRDAIIHEMQLYGQI
ncbi:Lipase [Colletotrichum siamense]|uniref:Lipase n=1 Tax=Colletotrichum siamense TaxID=690259 RepID=UPI001872686C|nr:Lipase [Colletotrichum siamense]KAF5511096.1 Lipase [Colletotrichum siamense]